MERSVDPSRVPKVRRHPLELLHLRLVDGGARHSQENNSENNSEITSLSDSSAGTLSTCLLLPAIRYDSHSGLSDTHISSRVDYKDNKTKIVLFRLPDLKSGRKTSVRLQFGQT